MKQLLARATYRAHAESRAYLRRHTRNPSFTYKFNEYARVRKALTELGHRDPAFTVNSKDAAHAWVTRLGVRTPELVGVFQDAAQVPWDALPSRVVVKPTRGTTSVGVHLLQRQGDGWIDLYRQRPYGTLELIDSLGRLANEGVTSRSVLVEHLVTDPRYPGQPPIDYKVHVFYGRVGLIECKSHGVDDAGEPVGYFFAYAPDWTPLGDGNAFLEDHVDPTIPPPVHAEELLEVARRISACLPRPHVRIDMFDDAEGPVFGELTPEMGGVLLLAGSVDRHLGELWEDAEARLRIRLIASGVLDPADGPQHEALETVGIR